MDALDDNSGSELCVRFESVDAIVEGAGEKVALDDLPLAKKPSFESIGLLGGVLVANVKVEARECIDSAANSVDIRC